jgi:DNA-binding NarL/FixJ family response regulator
MSPGLQVLVVDDHAAVREGLIRILAREEPGWEVCGVAGAHEALLQVAVRSFDVGIVDLSMPKMGGIELARALRAQGNRLPLLVLSMHAEEAYALRAFKAGASGYITKDRAAEGLVQAVRTVAGGGTWVPAALASRVVVNALGALEEAPHGRLTARELSVLRHLGQGAPLAEIARRLDLSESMVAVAECRIRDKLRLGSAQEVTDYAVAHALLP